MVIVRLKESKGVHQRLLKARGPFFIFSLLLPRLVRLIGRLLDGHLCSCLEAFGRYGA